MTQSATHGSELSCSVDLSAATIDDAPQASVTNAASGSEDPLFTTVINNSQDAASGFDGFGFSEALLRTLASKGYQEPSPIQRAAFPELMLGRDLVGQAQTGTGKTAAFALPLLERLQSGDRAPRCWYSLPLGNWPCKWPSRSRPMRPAIPT